MKDCGTKSYNLFIPEYIMTVAMQIPYDEAVQNLAPATPDRCLTLAVTSGKGGVGKSNLVANLAIHFANAGKKVIVLDADLGLANLDVLFGVRPMHTLHHVLSGRRKLLEVVMPVSRNLRLIAGGSGMASLADLSEELRSSFLNSLAALRQYADVLLIDTGAGLSSNVIGFLHYADEVVLVSTPEPTAMADAYGVIKTLANSGHDFPQVSIVVNRAASASEGFGVSNRLIAVSRQFLKVEVNYKGFILEDDAVSRAVRNQKPFVTMYPDCRAAHCVERLVESWTGVLPTKSSKQGSGFLDTLMGLVTGKR